jgi:3-phenylpropionate/trans-cinnamate dioxygenase ferredoxin reductase subunit
VDTALTGFEFDAAGRITAVLAGGHTIPADIVIAGIGLLPNVELAADAGIALDNGIAVDEFGQTSDPDIFAIGDCASHPSAYAGRRIRLESVPNAIEQARSTAAFFAGEKKPYNAIPWFWSDQYDLKLQMVGLNQGYDHVVLRGDPANRNFMAFYLKDGVVIAVDSVSRLAEFMVAKRLVASKAAPDPARLADETQPLKSLIAAASV